MKRPARGSDTRPSSAASLHTPAADGNNARRPELAAMRSAVAQSFDQGRQLLQFFVHAEQAQCDALKAWDGAANIAERAVGQASGWDELIAAQNEWLRDGFSRLIGTQAALASSWLELQARLLQQAQHRALDRSVTPGMDVVALRNRAEACLLDVRCHDGSPSDRFARAAGELSNCPSGAQGGELGWLAPTDCAPEFAREVFGHVEVGVLPRLVHSRFGLHVVEVLEREAGVTQPFEAVQGAVRMALRRQAFVTALRQCLQVLAGQADLKGVALDAVEAPLVR